MTNYRIDFGAFDDNRNFDWAEIRKVMTGSYHTIIDLGEVKFDTKEEAEEMLGKISGYVNTGIVEVVEA